MIFIYIYIYLFIKEEAAEEEGAAGVDWTSQTENQDA